MAASYHHRGAMPLHSTIAPADAGGLADQRAGTPNDGLVSPFTAGNSVLDRRRAGVLLHITSLPGPGANGTLGAEAFRFVDFLSNAGFSVWQTLPINPPHADGSPYQCLSVHAGNPALIDPQWLIERGWLAAGDVQNGNAQRWLNSAFDAFHAAADKDPCHSDYQRFVRDHHWWLDDYALYMAIREECGDDPWTEWPASLRDRWPAALRAALRRLSRSVAQYSFGQFVFYSQWKELRRYSLQRGVVLFGDMPIFVAGDSADVWACRHYFDLAENGCPRVVAGVPPDYFSSTGQRWGNPHYDWGAMEADGFKWWCGRLHSQLALYDWVRIDHFRGFEAYWEIPAESETAMEGRWIKAPGERLLETVHRLFEGSGLPLVAEDLGIITPEVEELRDRFGLPGMKILQFAFDSGPSNPYLPHHHPPNCVVYTGTHDNDTTLSWFEALEPEQKAYVYEYLGCPEIPMPWALIRCALASEAWLAMLPMQDILGLGKGYRMNTPGTATGNWQWRFRWDQVTDEITERLQQWIHLYGRRVSPPSGQPAHTTSQAPHPDPAHGLGLPETKQLGVALKQPTGGGLVDQT